jgi:hypothetical protein
MMMTDRAFDDDSATASSGPSRMIGVINRVVGKAKVVFVGEMGFRYQHNVDASLEKKGFEFVNMLVEAICIPQCEV